jgi:hypothetical protein
MGIAALRNAYGTSARTTTGPEGHNAPRSITVCLSLELTERLQGIEIYRAGEDGRIVEVSRFSDGRREVWAIEINASDALERHDLALAESGYWRNWCQPGISVHSRAQVSWSKEDADAHHATVVEALRPFNQGADEPQENREE